MTSAIILTDLSLDVLAEMANEAGSQVEGFARKTVESADRAGRYLLAAKEQVGHGKWSSWLRANWMWSQRSAQQYMLIAESNAQNSALLKDANSVSEALKLISCESAEKKPKPVVQIESTIPAYTTPDVSPVVPLPAKAETERGEDQSPPASRKASRSESESGKDSERSSQVVEKKAAEVIAAPSETRSEFEYAKAIERLNRVVRSELDKWPDEHRAEAVAWVKTIIEEYDV